GERGRPLEDLLRRGARAPAGAGQGARAAGGGGERPAAGGDDGRVVARRARHGRAARRAHRGRGGRGGDRGRRGRGGGGRRCGWRRGRGARRRGAGRRGTEGGKHHVPVGGRAQGQAPLLRAGGAGQDVLDGGGGATVPRVEEVRDHRAASGKHPTWPAAGEDGRHDQLARGDRGGRTRAGVASCACRYHGLVERAHGGDVSIVCDRLLQICGRVRRHRDREARERGGGVLLVVQGDVARSAPRGRNRARPRAIDVVRHVHLTRHV